MYHLSPCIVALPNKRVQSDAAAAAWYRDPNRLCDVLRIEAHFGKVAARLTRRALDARWDKNEMLNKQQIGKCGELLVQYKLLLNGVKSAHLTTDSGIDLVAYSLKTKEPITIQVKANLKAKPGGGKGKLALDWWLPEDSPADLVALADLSTNRVWLLNVEEISEFAQQHSSGRYHVYMYIDPTVKPSKAKRRVFTYEFEKFLLENRVHIYFE